MIEKHLFADLKIVDLSSVLAGPSVGSFFAEMGAEVVKIENIKTAGDVTRGWKLPSEKENKISAYFASVNFGKKYLFKDLTNPSHFSEVIELIKEADILISNFKTGDDIKFKISYEEVRKFNPQIIYAHLGGFIAQPDRTAYDVVLQAETGYMSMNGTEESGPLKMPVALIDVLAAHQLKEGILCALVNKSRTGSGCFVQCDLESSALAALSNLASNYLMTGFTSGLNGSLHPNIAPYGEMFPCADGKILVMAVGSDKHFIQFCQILGIPLIAQEEKFSTNYQRVIHRQELADLIRIEILKKDRDYWMDEFKSKHIPVGAVNSLPEVFERADVKSLILDEIIDGEKTARVKSVAFRLD